MTGRSHLRHIAFYFEVMEMFWNETEVVVTSYCECTKCHHMVCYKIVNFKLWEFHLHKVLFYNITFQFSYSYFPPLTTTCFPNSPFSWFHGYQFLWFFCMLLWPFLLFLFCWFNLFCNHVMLENSPDYFGSLLFLFLQDSPLYYLRSIRGSLFSCPRVSE